VSATRGTRKPDPATARLAGWIEPVIGAAGYDLEELVVTPAGRRSIVRVVVDRDRGVTLDDIAEVSRAVSAVLDDNDDDLGRSPYVLEVTSPGVDRPLTEQRHWRRSTGRLVKVEVAMRPLIGRIVAVDDAGVTFDVKGAQQQVGWPDLGPGKVQIEFNRADAPSDDAGEFDAAEEGD
jgi:ribosome maturation factor RimP